MTTQELIKTLNEEQREAFSANIKYKGVANITINRADGTTDSFVYNSHNPILKKQFQKIYTELEEWAEEYRNTPRLIAEDIVTPLYDSERLLLADTIVYGGWGDTEDYFNDVSEGGWVICPNEAWKGKHFERRELSARFKELYKALKLIGTGEWFKSNGVINWHKDYWDDGSGSVLIIRYDVYKELEEWAESYVKQYNSNNQ